MLQNFTSKVRRSLSRHILGKEEEQDLHFIDDVLGTLLSLTEEEAAELSYFIAGAQIKTLCKMAIPLLLADPIHLNLEAPIKVVGDIHGQFFDLLRIFDLGGHPPKTTYLFLGDYVDRGPYGIEVMALLLIYKIKYPDKIFLLRGNHECDITSKIYGFCDQCQLRYSYRMWEKFTMVFDVLPAAATVGGKFFCVHGGLSPQMDHVNDISFIQRPCKVMDGSLLSDLVWSDPDASHKGWCTGKRGISGTFGSDMLKDFKSRHGFVMVVRAHQVAQKGYDFFNGERDLVTLFSAPNYCGVRNNMAAMMTITSSYTVEFDVLKPIKSNAASRMSSETIYGSNDLLSLGDLPAGQAPFPPPLASQDSAHLEEAVFKAMQEISDEDMIAGNIDDDGDAEEPQPTCSLAQDTNSGANGEAVDTVASQLEATGLEDLRGTFGVNPNTDA